VAEKPKGVTIVAILTLLSAVALFFLCFMLFVVSSIGGMSNAAAGGGLPLWLLAWILSPLALAILALITAVGILNGTKYAWYASIVLWATLLIYFSQIALMIDTKLSFVYVYELETALAMAAPLIYSVGCLAYFQTKGVKEYFGLSRRVSQS
jgi:hypothetical protein